MSAGAVGVAMAALFFGGLANADQLNFKAEVNARQGMVVVDEDLRLFHFGDSTKM